MSRWCLKLLSGFRFFRHIFLPILSKLYANIYDVDMLNSQRLICLVAHKCASVVMCCTIWGKHFEDTQQFCQKLYTFFI